MQENKHNVSNQTCCHLSYS